MCIASTSAAVPAMARLAGDFRRRGRPIVHIVRLYLRDGSNPERCRRHALAGGADMLIAGTEGTEIAEALVPNSRVRLDVERLLAGCAQELSASEHVIYKPRWGAFHRTPLEDHLRDRGVDTFVFVGANFPKRPRTSIYEASERDFPWCACATPSRGCMKKALRSSRGSASPCCPRRRSARRSGAQ
jgi:hypothetical protein